VKLFFIDLLLHFFLFRIPLLCETSNHPPSPPSPPQVDSTLTDADTPFYPPAAATAASDSASSLPPSEATAAVWVELLDEGTGRVYYYNNVSQATQWMMPPGFQVCHWGCGSVYVSLFVFYPFLPPQCVSECVCSLNRQSFLLPFSSDPASFPYSVP